MTHYIIVKFLDSVADKTSLCEPIRALFSPAAGIPGIHRIDVFPSCIDKTNRHDLMIRMEMAPEALAVFDASAIHQEWKTQFGRYIATKTIFDCE